jgi:hypothetical protein
LEKHLQPTRTDAAAWNTGQRSGLADMLAHTYRGARMARNLCKGAFVENYTHPCVIAADHLMCSRPLDVLICNTYCTFDLCSTRRRPQQQVRRGALPPQVRRGEGASASHSRWHRVSHARFRARGRQGIRLGGQPCCPRCPRLSPGSPRNSPSLR